MNDYTTKVDRKKAKKLFKEYLATIPLTWEEYILLDESSKKVLHSEFWRWARERRLNKSAYG